VPWALHDASQRQFWDVIPTRVCPSAVVVIALELVVVVEVVVVVVLVVGMGVLVVELTEKVDSKL